jgi:TP901 family phage tail tape measure protein
MSKALNGAALRFIGIQAAIQLASQAFRKMNEWIDVSVKQFREFENSMAEVSTILTGESYQALVTLTEGVKQLSVQYGQTAVDMSRGLYQILSAAVPVEKALNMLNTATKASIAGLTSVETSVDVLTSIINSYGKSVEQAAGVSDILFQTVVRGKLRFEDLASSLGYITPIAAAAGVAFEEIAAALATVTRMGLHVDMASRGLALTIQNIVSPTKQASEAAKKYGVDMSAVAIRVFGLKGFITDLSAAVKEFGLAVLPTMVRNMRSLRVVMALASEEGLKGFAQDLDLVYASTGRTNEALAKMIKTQQREAEVVKQSQEVIQRSIGETWSPIKRNIEATKLWFATFLAGGFSIEKANDAIKDLSETLTKNREKIYESIESMGKMGQQPIFTQLFNMDDYDANQIAAVVNSVTDIAKVQEYLTAQSKMMPTRPGGMDLFTWSKEILEGQLAMLEGASHSSTIDLSHMEGQINLVTEAFKELDKFEFKEGVHVVDQLKDMIGDLDAVLAENVNIMSDNVDSFNAFWASIDTAREQVFGFKTNILELQNAIFGLSAEVSDMFTDLAGQKHRGTLGMEIDVKSFDTAMDRMSKFSSMIKDYGSDWEDMFYDIFEGKTYSMGDEEISYIAEYESELKDAVNTVYEFSDAQKEVKKVMNEVNKAIMRNNIMIAELQLKGMLRRRGATRAEERAIKKLQIDNMKERLKEKKASVEAMEDIDKQAYDDAQAEIKEYFDSQKFYLYLMKDAREDELSHMVETFNRKESLLEHYKEALGTQERYLQKAHQIEVDLLTWIQTEFPTIAELYENIYGVSIPESIQKSIDAMNEWLRLQDKKPATKKAPSIAIIPTPEGMKSPLAANLMVSNRKMYELLKLKGLPGFARGIDYMPRTEPAIIHQGERVVPAGKDIGGNIIIESVTIQVNQIADVGSVEKVGAVLGAVGQTNLADRTGKSKFRPR